MVAMDYSLLVVLLAAACVLRATTPALAQTVQVWFKCSPANYSTRPESAYGTSLARTLSDVVSAAGHSSDGYATAHRQQQQEAPYGVAICYADAGPPEVCRLCLRMAAGNVTADCPGAAGADMMYNNCLLRYAGARFPPQPDMEQRFSFYNNNMTSAGDAQRYGAALNRLMDRLAPSAAAGEGDGDGDASRRRRLWAFGQTNITGDRSLYGFAQCLPDLSPADCRRCLQSLAASLPMTKGGRAYSLTCYTRFEVVPFYMPPNTTRLVVTVAPAPETSSSLPAAGSRAAKRSKFRTTLTVSTVAVILVVMACLIIAIKIGKSGKFQSMIGNHSNPRENIEELMGKYGPLAPKRYKYTHLKEITKSFGEKLGEGGYGTVYKGTLPDGHHVAVKFLHDLTTNGEEFINEVISIRRTSHVNVVTLLGFCLEGSKRALIYDYMPNGSLDKFIYAENSKQTLGWDKLYEIATGIARGLEYLHRGCNTRIIHFDIKPHNILLDSDFVPKIADFGLAKLCNPKESYLSMAGMRGTIGFIAPEVFSRRFGVVSTKSDVYSYGMMLLEMVGGRKNLRASVERESEAYFPDWIHSHLAEVGSLHSFDMGDETEETARKMASVGLWCIQLSPMSRPTMSKVLEMFDKSVDQLEIPPKQFFYSAIEEESSEEQN